jgi:hypothetical protein
MYKYFTTRFGVNAIEKIKELRNEFPGCSYAAGICKDKKGIYAFASNEIKDYGEKWELETGDIFWAPTAPRIEEIRNNLAKYITDWIDRIPVKLTCGKELTIFPASALPRKVLFSRKRIVKDDTPFDQSLPYGKLAYQMYDRSQNNETIKLDDPQMMELISMALKLSYTLPMPIWDVLDLVNQSDIDKLFAAALGMDWEFLQTELKKSQVASPQATGTSAT